ncbi:MAG: Eco57I restriction-modification methylase domain-containing protein, partial [Chloroflexota bacterium]
NYPLVARRDFFDVMRDDAPFVVPFKNNGEILKKHSINRVNAVVGNPPYVRQEKITEYYGAQYKKRLQEMIAKKEAPGAALSGRSDIHVYFFPHAASFLEEGGYLGLLTSSTWLDTTYGFRLQKYLLDNFEIIAIFESASEPWFTGARVTTAATILRKQSDKAKRDANIVHFVKIRRELSEIFGGIEDEGARRRYLERLRDHIESLKQNETNSDYRVRSIRQGELYELGRAKIQVSEDEEEDENGNGNGTAQQTTLHEQTEEYKTTAPMDDYVGYKWGIFLRAPEIFFKLMERAKDRFVPLAEIAEIQRGLTSGADDFFYPRDITDEEIERLKPREFKEFYGITPSEAKKIRVVKAGDGSAHLIEARFLEPVVFNLMEISSIKIDLRKLERQIFLCSFSKSELKQRGFKHALAYIRWGEEERFNLRPTCASREIWYNLSGGKRGAMLWSKTHRYRHIIPLNTKPFIANCNLYDIVPQRGINAQMLCAILNSTPVALLKHLFGRQMGGDPLLKTEVSDMQMMLVPDVRLASPEIVERIRTAFTSMRKREMDHLVIVDGEGTMPSGDLPYSDRRALDDAVLELLGFTKPEQRRSLLKELYVAITVLYREIRATEKKMQKFRAMTARHGRPSPQSIADEIWESFTTKPIAKSLAEFVHSSAKTDQVLLPPGKAKLILNDMFNPNSLQIGGQYVALGAPERAEYALQLSEDGISGQVAIPVDALICKAALHNYRAHVKELNELFASNAAAYSADEQMQERVVRELWRRASRAY